MDDQAALNALDTFFNYPISLGVCGLIYATNVIESFNRQLRKASFPTDDAC